MKRLILAACAAAILCASCGKKIVDEGLSKKARQNRAHQWYCLSSAGFEKVSLPQNAPKVSDLPWTEAIRISSGGSNFKTDVFSADAFAVVNRLGILSFTNGNPELISDAGIFSGETAGSLFFLNEVPFFALYRDRTFNKKPSPKERRPFIVRVQSNPALCIPLLYYSDFGIESDSEITDIARRGEDFICVVKSYEENRTEFSYFLWTPSANLATLTQRTVLQSMRKMELEAHDYRDALAHDSLAKAPQRLQELLSDLPNNFSCSIICRSSGQNSKSVYLQGVQGARTQNASATLAPNYALAVFNDGTTFFAGSLNGRPVLNNGKTLAFRLPKLPDGYVYTEAFISQTTLVVGWEEATFYSTGRSGFLTVDMDKVLYQ